MDASVTYIYSLNGTVNMRIVNSTVVCTDYSLQNLKSLFNETIYGGHDTIGSAFLLKSDVDKIFITSASNLYGGCIFVSEGAIYNL